MEVDILNIKDAKKFVTDLLFDGKEVPNISAAKLKDICYVEDNKDAIAVAIISQYLKDKVIILLKDTIVRHNKDFTFVEYSDDLPDWAKDKITKGGQIITFNSAKVSEGLKDTLTQVKDFLYSKTMDKIDEEIKKKKGTPNYKLNVRMDFLRTDINYNPFGKVLAATSEWYREDTANAEKTKQDMNFKTASDAGTIKVMDFEDGCYAVQLITPAALDFESQTMGHCVGDDFYDIGVMNKVIQIYSIRGRTGEPHVTFEVRQNKQGLWTVYQCKGKQDKTPITKYKKNISSFMHKMNFEIEEEGKNIGLIKQDGKYYDIWNLPKGFVIKGDLDIAGMELTALPDLSTIVVEGNFNCCCNQLTTLKGTPKKVGGDFDCSHNLLSNLDGSPNFVSGEFNCAYNKLTTLQGCPANFTNFDCSHNQLSNLHWIPEKIAGDFNCCYNQLTTLVGAPKEVKGYFWCHNNQLTTLDGAPRKIGGIFYCSDNKFTDQGTSPEYVLAYQRIKGIEKETLIKMVQNRKNNLSKLIKNTLQDFSR